VQTFKKGPDYIDPLWLGAAAGRPCHNLDFFTMAPGEIEALFARRMTGADLGLIEGNKGLYDGLDLDGANSNAALAKYLAAPVVLVIDARGMTRGIAPLLLGYRAFDAGVRAFWREHRFRVAGWTELQRAFEAASGRALERFFAQWLERRGAPAVRIAAAQMQQTAGGWRVAVTLSQDTPTYELRVPVMLRTERGEETRVLELAQTSASFILESAARPQELVLDPDVRVLRRLAPDEAPPILRQAMIDPALVTVFASATVQGDSRQLATLMLDHPLRVAAADAPPGIAPLLVIGLHAEIDAWLLRFGLPPRPAALAGKGTAQAWIVARPGAGPFTVISAVDAQSLALIARPLPHYGRQSFVVFEGARQIERGVWPASPPTWRLP
jgi:hypothetical protein